MAMRAAEAWVRHGMLFSDVFAHGGRACGVLVAGAGLPVRRACDALVTSRMLTPVAYYEGPLLNRRWSRD